MADDEFSYELKVPEERIAVLIGTNGETKKEIEQATHSTLDISKEGDVQIMGNDGLSLFTAREIVRAIGRGFNPKVALQLIKMDYALEIIDMTDLVGKSKHTLERIRGRLIGSEGKARREIEHLTGAAISIYGKTIGIIGEADNVALARQAMEMLLSGSMHKTVYQFLEKKRRDMVFR